MCTEEEPGIDGAWGIQQPAEAASGLLIRWCVATNGLPLVAAPVRDIGDRLL